jgi:hypothetical protein
MIRAIIVLAPLIAIGCDMPTQRYQRNMSRIDKCRRLCTSTEDAYEYRYESIESSQLGGIPDGRCTCLYRAVPHGGAR